MWKARTTVKKGKTTKNGKPRWQVFCTEGKKDSDRRFIGREDNAINLTKPATARSRMQEKRTEIMHAISPNGLSPNIE